MKGECAICFPDETMVYETEIGKTNYIVTSEIPEQADETILDSLLRLIQKDLSHRIDQMDS